MRALRQAELLFRALRFLQEARLPRLPEEQQEREQDAPARNLQNVLVGIGKAQKLLVRLKTSFSR
jgi:hypothetical protein